MKAAVTHLTRSVASDLGPMNIRVNSISPGAIATGIFGKNAGVEGEKADPLLDSVKAMFATVQPIPRSGPTDDIAHAAVFLASEWSSFVTGHNLVVDGGASSGRMYYQQGMALRAELYKGDHAGRRAAEQLMSSPDETDQARGSEPMISVGAIVPRSTRASRLAIFCGAVGPMTMGRLSGDEGP